MARVASGGDPGATAKLTVITPVGPGHEAIVSRARQSVQVAAANSLGPFKGVDHLVIDDTLGELGRGRARNTGIDEAETDWLFFLDADDLMCPWALKYCDFKFPATFGAIYKDGGGGLHRWNVWPCSWYELALHGSLGTIAMGFFCKTDIARKLRFDEDLIMGEDYEFYMRLPGFIKVRAPLVTIGYRVPSAGGPRSPADFNGKKGTTDWTNVCNARIVEAYDRDPAKFGLSRDALLAAAPTVTAKPGGVPRPI